MQIYYNMPWLKNLNALTTTIKYVAIKKMLFQRQIVLFMPAIPLSALNKQNALTRCWILQMMDLVLTFDNLTKSQTLVLLPAHWIRMVRDVTLINYEKFYPAQNKNPPARLLISLQIFQYSYRTFSTLT